MPNPFNDWGRMYRSNQQSPVLRIQGRVQREDGTVPYIAVDMAIDWIRTGQLGPPPPGSTPGPGESGARPAQ